MCKFSEAAINCKLKFLDTKLTQIIIEIYFVLKIQQIIIRVIKILSLTQKYFFFRICNIGRYLEMYFYKIINSVSRACNSPKNNLISIPTSIQSPFYKILVEASFQLLVAFLKNTVYHYNSNFLNYPQNVQHKLKLFLQFWNWTKNDISMQEWNQGKYFIMWTFIDICYVNPFTKTNKLVTAGVRRDVATKSVKLKWQKIVAQKCRHYRKIKLFKKIY